MPIGNLEAIKREKERKRAVDIWCRECVGEVWVTMGMAVAVGRDWVN